MDDLGARLIARLEATGAAVDDRAALERAIGDAVERGERALPHHPVTREAFVDRVALALGAGATPVTRERLEALRIEDLYLACALAAGDREAVQRAEAELLPAARETIGRVDAARDFVEEVAQLVRMRVLVGENDDPPAITQYRGSGPLVAWIRVVARRIAIDRKRAVDPRTDHHDELDQLPAPDDPELAVLWRTCAAEYKEALARAFATLERRDRTLLRQRHVDKLGIDALGKIYRVDPSTAFRWVQRVEQDLVARTRSDLRKKLALTDSQMRSMDRLVSDRLELSLTSILRGRRR